MPDGLHRSEFTLFPSKPERVTDQLTFSWRKMNTFGNLDTHPCTGAVTWWGIVHRHDPGTVCFIFRIRSVSSLDHHFESISREISNHTIPEACSLSLHARRVPALHLRQAATTP